MPGAQVQLVGSKCNSTVRQVKSWAIPRIYEDDDRFELQNKSMKTPKSTKTTLRGGWNVYGAFGHLMGN